VGLGGCDELGEELASLGGVEHLVGVEDEDPVAAGGGEDLVAGVGEVVPPRDGEGGGVELLCDGESVVGRAGVAEDDAVDEGSDAREAAFEGGASIFDDHGEFNSRCKGRFRGRSWHSGKMAR